jgi:glutathione reductase (NADPH)
MTEEEARAKFGPDNIKVYTSTFNDLYYSMMPLVDDATEPHIHKVPSKHKIIVAGSGERVVGLHVVGRASDEILQGFGVAIKMGATKADLDRCVAIHPTAAEELVTLK